MLSIQQWKSYIEKSRRSVIQAWKLLFNYHQSFLRSNYSQWFKQWNGLTDWLTDKLKLDINNTMTVWHNWNHCSSVSIITSHLLSLLSSVSSTQPFFNFVTVWTMLAFTSLLWSNQTSFLIPYHHIELQYILSYHLNLISSYNQLCSANVTFKIAF